MLATDVTVVYFEDLFRPVSAALTVGLLVVIALSWIERRRLRRLSEQLATAIEKAPSYSVRVESGVACPYAVRTSATHGDTYRRCKLLAGHDGPCQPSTTSTQEEK